MILTKSEFRDEFGFKNLSSVSNLLDSESIIANDDGLIDLNHKKNKAWAKKRRKQLKEAEQKKEQERTEKLEKAKKQDDLEFNILNQKLTEHFKKNELLSLKLAKENRDVVESDVLNRVVTMVFDSLFKQLVELPAVCSDDIVNTVLSAENPNERITVFLTEKILTNLKTALEIAEKAAKKYYK